MKIYFKFFDLIHLSQKKLQAIIEAEESVTRTETDTTVNAEDQRRQRDMRLRMDIDDSDIVITGTNPTRISRKQVSFNCRRMILHYLTLLD